MNIILAIFILHIVNFNLLLYLCTFSRSDPVKLGSSGHTSGDELETATSSDIEIISR